MWQCLRTIIPYPERIGPRALSSAGPYPSEPPLRPKSGRTRLHRDCPTLVHGGRSEAWGRLLKRKKENHLAFCSQCGGLILLQSLNSLTSSPLVAQEVSQTQPKQRDCKTKLNCTSVARLDWHKIAQFNETNDHKSSNNFCFYLGEREEFFKSYNIKSFHLYGEDASFYKSELNNNLKRKKGLVLRNWNDLCFWWSSVISWAEPTELLSRWSQSYYVVEGRGLSHWVNVAGTFPVFLNTDLEKTKPISLWILKSACLKKNP